MKTFQKQAAQGDVLITKIEEIPATAKIKQPESGYHIIAHSETGHHHVLSANTVDLYEDEGDTMVAYAVVKEATPLEHQRSFDTHETINLLIGTYRINRQREYTPEGWRRAAD